MPTTLFPTRSFKDPLFSNPTEPPFYTMLPTQSHVLPSSTDIDLKTYQVGLKEEDSSDFSGFVINSQKETACSKIDAAETCKLECVVTIKLYHNNLMIHEPTLVKYEASCAGENTF